MTQRQQPDRRHGGGRPRRTRLQDVAALAGVSVKTVSNVVNGYAHVSDRTRARVDSALEQLDYRPNLAARTLRRGRTGLVALAVPEIDAPYFAELAGHVVTAAERHGWTVLIDQTDGSPERERLVIQGFRSQLIDGLIFSPIASGHAELAHRQDTTPMVLLGERIFDGPADHVSIDNVAAARLAVEHLADLGRRRIAAIGRQHRATAGTARLRLQGYDEALAALGLPAHDDLVADTASWRRTDGAAAMQRLLDRDEPPDAVFCFNDLLALGALRALHDAGLRAPEDVAVVGFDDIEDGRYSCPSLTTVRPDKERIARLAIDLLADRLDGSAGAGGDGPVPRELLAPYDLAVRETTVGSGR